MAFIEITNGKVTLNVTQASFESIFAKQGYKKKVISKPNEETKTKTSNEVENATNLKEDKIEYEGDIDPSSVKNVNHNYSKGEPAKTGPVIANKK